ncbi:MAG: hypothetical protein KBG80_08185, partial [Breznakibacter sp.]|nr:hypothetical protein [Breznakibacter sp.]
VGHRFESCLDHLGLKEVYRDVDLFFYGVTKTLPKQSPIYLPFALVILSYKELQKKSKNNFSLVL